MSRWFKELLIIMIGNFILAVSVVAFILPNDILSGGVAGVAVLLGPFLALDQSLLITIINTCLFIVGLIFLGKHFAFTTLISTITYPFFIMILPLFLPDFHLDPILAAIYAGLLGGIGIGLVVRQGASTGGMDIPPLIAHKYLHADLSKCVMITDGITVLLGLWIYGVETVLIGLISVYVTGKAISFIITFGASKAKSIEIISDYNDAISSDIQSEMNRGTTLLMAEGGYTRKKRPVLMVIVTEKEYHTVMNIIERYDKEAFLIVKDVQEVHGEGFSFEARI